MAKFDLGYFAQLLGAELRGSSERAIKGVASLGQANSEDISFYSGDAKYRDLLSGTRAGAVLLRESDAEYCSSDVLIVADPYLSYAHISAEFHKLAQHAAKAQAQLGVHGTAVVHEDARLAPDAMVGAHCYVGAGTVIGAGSQLNPGAYVGEDCVLGERCRIDSGARLTRNVRMGNDVVVQSNTVVGSDGFGYAWNKSKTGWDKIYQLGGVQVGNEVEIGAMSTINCGALDDTVIEDGVKMDCQVHLAHNVRVGAATAMAANAMVAGSTELGKRCRIGGGVRIMNGIKIADEVELIAGSVVFQTIPKSGRYGGIPAYPLKDWMKNSINQSKLHSLFNRVDRLEKNCDIEGEK